MVRIHLIQFLQYFFKLKRELFHFYVSSFNLKFCQNIFTLGILKFYLKLFLGLFPLSGFELGLLGWESATLTTAAPSLNWQYQVITAGNRILTTVEISKTFAIERQRRFYLSTAHNLWCFKGLNFIKQCISWNNLTLHKLPLISLFLFLVELIAETGFELGSFSNSLNGRVSLFFQ